MPRSTKGLMLIDCNCLFFVVSICSLIDTFMYATRLLTGRFLGQFQQMFEESGFGVYENRGLVEVDVSKTTEAERAADNRRLTINELMERTRDVTNRHVY